LIYKMFSTFVNFFITKYDVLFYFVLYFYEYVQQTKVMKIIVLFVFLFSIFTVLHMTFENNK